MFGCKLDLQLTYISLLGSWMFMVDMLNLFMGVINKLIRSYKWEILPCMGLRIPKNGSQPTSSSLPGECGSQFV